MSEVAVLNVGAGDVSRRQSGMGRMAEASLNQDGAMGENTNINTKGEPYILDDEYRKTMDEHFQAIARVMYEKQILRAPWRVEIDGTVFKFTITGYNKKGSPAHNLGPCHKEIQG